MVVVDVERDLALNDSAMPALTGLPDQVDESEMALAAQFGEECAEVLLPELELAFADAERRGHVQKAVQQAFPL